METISFFMGSPRCPPLPSASLVLAVQLEEPPETGVRLGCRGLRNHHWWAGRVSHVQRASRRPRLLFLDHRVGV